MITVTCHFEGQVMVNAAQLRAARNWLGWTQAQLAERAGVAARTIARFEIGQSVPYDRTLADVRQVLETAGIEFIFEDGMGVGICCRRRAR